MGYIFGIYINFGYKNPSILTPYNLIDIALIIGRVTNAVAGMSQTIPFHEFFGSNLWRVFDIWPKCVVQCVHSPEGG